MKRALLFVNGEPPQQIPDRLNQYDYIACTDGAYHNYLAQMDISPHFIIGDLDSIHHDAIPDHIQVIHTPDQQKTDFEKAILFLANHGVSTYDIYGATGHATDHFLGNLSVALQYYKQLNFTFHDNFSRFFFVQPNTHIHDVKNKTISLIPLTPVTNLTITGFKYPLTHANLQLAGLTSLRNQAIQNTVSVNFDKGDLLVLINS